MAKRKTIEEFINDAKKVHGDKYDYSEVEYINTNTKVCIICLKHGGFWQTPSKHLSGKGCPKCAGNAKGTTEDFVRRARKMHGDKYDYSQVCYKSTHENVKIICPEHGEFLQSPHNHLKGKGCKHCSQKRTARKQSKTLEQFIMEAREVHGNKYDYSQAEYVNAYTKTSIICPIHGLFLQTPDIHLRGHGCSRCGGSSVSELLKKSDTDFINEAKKAHGDKYDYSQTEYRNNKTKLKIICPEHGPFFQRPNDHFRGSGCPACAGIESPQEIKVYEKLLEVFSESDIEKQYDKDERYPFRCDFYIKPLDLFIELNIHWTHGGHWFDPDNSADTKRLETIKAKSEKSEFYKTAIEIWTKRDVRKRETAERNGINYKVFWNNDLSDFYQWFKDNIER